MSADVKLKLLIDEKISDWNNLFKDILSTVEILRVANHHELNRMGNSEKSECDIIIFDSDDDYRNQLDTFEEFKNYNPDVKLIFFTSIRNRRYRAYYLSHGVDYFLFKENETDLLKSIVRHHITRKTRII